MKVTPIGFDEDGIQWTRYSTDTMRSREMIESLMAVEKWANNPRIKNQLTPTRRIMKVRLHLDNTYEVVDNQQLFKGSLADREAFIRLREGRYL
jgi:DNA repair protein RadC